MQKNAKKLQKNLHISKICCNFALSFQMRERENQKRKPIKNQKIMTRKSFQNAVAKMANAEFEWHSIEVVVEKVTIIGGEELTSNFAIVAVHHIGKDFRTMFYHYPSMKQIKVDYAGRYEDINEAYKELGRRAAV